MLILYIYLMLNNDVTKPAFMTHSSLLVRYGININHIPGERTTDKESNVYVVIIKSF